MNHARKFLGRKFLGTRNMQNMQDIPFFFTRISEKGGKNGGLLTSLFLNLLGIFFIRVSKPPIFIGG